MASLIGRTLSHYRITELLGEGGMGEVYRAEDSSLGREVALKVLPAEVAGDADRLARFQREARAVAALNHPNIVTIHSVEEAEGVHFLTMELVAGKTLDQRIPAGGMPLGEFFAIALPLVEALAAAHARGVVHRDVKAANVMVTGDGRTKILDFGLARMGELDADPSAATQTATQLGAVLGTPAYMAPEQARGLPATALSDVFSTGVLLYEMLTGERPFRRIDGPSTVHAIVHDTPRPLATRRPDVPHDLARIVARCLEKDPAARYASAEELRAALAASRSRHVRSPLDLRSLLARWQVVVPAVAVLAGLAALAVWGGLRSARSERVRTETVPRIEALLEQGRYFEAFTLGREAQRRLPDDPTVRKLIERSSWAAEIETTPAGAEVAFRAYDEPGGPWHSLGRTPIDGARIPAAYVVFRLTREGHEPMLLAGGDPSFAVALVPAGTAPEGMVRVPAGVESSGAAEPVELGAFWIDRYEVTHRDYAAFVAAGGYSDPRYWQEPVVYGDHTLEWEEAMTRFVDATGRPGPAGWELGGYPEGEGDLPVRGVSWFEAAAYARWAGKDLPTVYHWRRAAGMDIFADILGLSNFGGDGPAAPGTYHGVGPWGTYDMAGNVKEWCRNAAGALRYSLGGGWDEAPYLFSDVDARPPLERRANQGFRCVRYDQPPNEELMAPVEGLRYDFAQVEPVDDELYAFFAGLYAYDPSPLDARVELTDDASPHWRRETVSFEPAYEGPRMVAHLFLPANATPPYQAVIYRPSSAANQLPRVEDYVNLPDYVPRSGRALVVPAYWGTFERGVEARSFSASAMRERVTRQVRDLRRTIDYLETRPDIDSGKLAYAGVSAGGEYGPVYLALEDRLQAAVLVVAGFHDAHMLREPPEVNPWNFAPRVSVPTLMINGENDFTLPYETAQKPMFDLLGTDPEHKRLVVIAGGHVTTDRHALIRHALAWFDRYLGPVQPAPTGR
ncbi:MAG TPA: protein kinase [Thermoanaerobaculia bacterium]|nr:protein kinase [Thermoanaerobaculia bacterium]